MKPIFNISGVDYYADPDATSVKLIDDATMLLESAAAVVNTMASGFCEEDGEIAAKPDLAAQMLFGVLNQIQMARGIAIEAIRRTHGPAETA